MHGSGSEIQPDPEAADMIDRQGKNALQGV